MSTYANFYLKTKSGEYIELYSVSVRNDPYREIFSLPYDKLKRFSEKDFSWLFEVIDREIKEMKSNKKTYLAQISFLKEVKGENLDEIMERYNDCLEIIEECDEEIETLECIRARFKVYSELESDICYKNSHDAYDGIYAGIEASPKSWHEDEDEDENESEDE